jgi:hypothetical protein
VAIPGIHRVGATMAATLLNRPRAVDMSIYVVRAFVQLRELIREGNGLQIYDPCTRLRSHREQQRDVWAWSIKQSW